MFTALTPLLRVLARPYLALYDLAMRLGPKWGPILLGYGPVLLGILAFILKSRLLDPVMHPDTATVSIFVAFALCGPLMHVGTRILSETLHKSRTGTWPRTPNPRFDPNGKDSPTVIWVEAVREWSRG